MSETIRPESRSGVSRSTIAAPIFLQSLTAFSARALTSPWIGWEPKKLRRTPMCLPLRPSFLRCLV